MKITMVSTKLHSLLVVAFSFAFVAASSSATAFEFTKKLIAPDGATGDRFGYSVALAGDTALIGTQFDDDNGSGSGSAYLFDTITGNLLHKLTAPDGAQGDQFGYSVALAGDTALIGTQFDDDNGTGSGSAYLFDTITGSLIRKFIAPDGAQGDQFGFSVALTGDMAIISSWKDDDNGTDSGSAYLFRVPEPSTVVLLLLGFIGAPKHRR